MSMIYQPQNFEDAWRIAQILAGSTGVSREYQNNPNNCFLAMSMGEPLGFNPPQALKAIAIIKNRPCIWGDGMMALIQSHADCEYIKEWFNDDKSVAYCETKRVGHELIQRSFSLDDARKANLLGKDVWAGYAERMLQMRARAFVLRDAFAYILQGMAMVEEVQDIMDDVVAATTAPTTAPAAATSSERIGNTLEGKVAAMEGQVAEAKRQGLTPAPDAAPQPGAIQTPPTEPTPDPTEDAMEQAAKPTFPEPTHLGSTPEETRELHRQQPVVEKPQFEDTGYRTPDKVRALRCTACGVQFWENPAEPHDCADPVPSHPAKEVEPEPFVEEPHPEFTGTGQMSPDGNYEWVQCNNCAECYWHPGDHTCEINPHGMPDENAHESAQVEGEIAAGTETMQPTEARTGPGTGLFDKAGVEFDPEVHGQERDSTASKPKPSYMKNGNFKKKRNTDPEKYESLLAAAKARQGGDMVPGVDAQAVAQGTQTTEPVATPPQPVVEAPAATQSAPPNLTAQTMAQNPPPSPGPAYQQPVADDPQANDPTLDRPVMPPSAGPSEAGHAVVHPEHQQAHQRILSELAMASTMEEVTTAVNGVGSLPEEMRTEIRGAWSAAQQRVGG